MGRTYPLVGERSVRGPLLDLTIVTTCYNYGQYLAEWAQSIVASHRTPVRVCIVDNGSTDDSPRQIDEAVAMLTAAGIPAEAQFIERTDFGAARNVAVAMARTEWVMHFDADDTLMPHALDDIARLAPGADVVALGYERRGDPMAVMRPRIRVYTDSQGAVALRRSVLASGVSPFRRSFWQRAPYVTDQRGGWDTALWIGFAKLGARFRATLRPGFWYRQHRDSVYNMRYHSGWPAAQVGQQLRCRRAGFQGVSVIVPRASDHGGPRDRAWTWLRAWWSAEFPDWELIEGHAPAHPWRKGAAVRDGLTRATGAILVIADADCFVAPEGLRRAVERIQQGAPWVVPHADVYRLHQVLTEQLLTETPRGFRSRTLSASDLARPRYRGYAGGGLLVVTRPMYEATGGIPDRFVGWGAEDEALAVILDGLVGSHERLEYPLLHLWHPASPAKQDRSQRLANRAALAELKGARFDPEGLYAAALAMGEDGSRVRSPRLTPNGRRLVAGGVRG